MTPLPYTHSFTWNSKRISYQTFYFPVEFWVNWFFVCYWTMDSNWWRHFYVDLVDYLHTMISIRVRYHCRDDHITSSCLFFPVSLTRKCRFSLIMLLSTSVVNRWVTYHVTYTYETFVTEQKRLDHAVDIIKNLKVLR